MKRISAVGALSAVAALVFTIAYFSVSNRCWNTQLFSILYSTLIEFDRKFTFEENFLIWSDRLTAESTANRTIRCAMSSDPLPLLALHETLPAPPNWRGPFIFGGNNFNYGFADVRDDVRVKITTSQNVFGFTKLEDVFLVVRNQGNLQWSAFNKKSASFERQDSRCLECHGGLN